MELQKLEKRKAFIVNVIYFALILMIAYVSIKYVIKWMMPFLLGLVIALIFTPLINLISRKTHISKRIWACIMVVFVYLILGTLIWLSGWRLFVNVKEWIINLPQYYASDIYPFLMRTNDGIMEFAQRFSPDFADVIGDMLSNAVSGIQSYVVDLSTSFVGVVAAASKRVPFYLISLVFTILSSLFISMDYENIKDFIKRQLPEKQSEMISDIKSFLGKTIGSYAKAYLILMVITFAELVVGLFVLRVDGAVWIAAIIAVADAFPVLGTGTIVLPWAVIELVKGEFLFAAGLVVLYLVVTIVRQFIEPKIVGDQLGLPPIVAIISIYLGFIWFGIFGAILFPISMNILNSLQKAGKINLWK